MSNPFIGEIKLVGFNFAPIGWAFCAGQLVSIAQNTALFNLIGTIYGGDGQETFALPDLQGRFAIHQGQGPGLSNFTIGETLGAEQVTITGTQMPAHTHAVTAVRGPGAVPGTTPTNGIWSNEVKGTPQNTPYTAGPPQTYMASSSISAVGGNQPHENMPPFLVLNYVIALEGIFPQQN